jgi:two-component system LytT family sensor kinase
LYFEVCNNLPVNTQDTTTLIHTNKNSSGIGLANVKKRLELGYKPQDYHLEINQTDQHFTVKLKLKV